MVFGPLRFTAEVTTLNESTFIIVSQLRSVMFVSNFSAALYKLNFVAGNDLDQ
jgi:hypothetical protein